MYAFGSLRRSTTFDYRVKARITGAGAVYLSFSQFSAGSEKTIGTETLVSGLTYVPGTDLRVHAQVSGISPTVGIRAYTSTATTNAPISISFDALQALPFTPSTVAPVPAFSNIWVIVLENEEEPAIIGSSAAPYLNSLAANYGLASNYDALTHGSHPGFECHRAIRGD